MIDDERIEHSGHGLVEILHMFDAFWENLLIELIKHFEALGYKDFCKETES